MTVAELNFLDASYDLYVAQQIFNRESCYALMRTRRQSFEMRERYDSVKDRWELAFKEFASERQNDQRAPAST